MRIHKFIDVKKTNKNVLKYVMRLIVPKYWKTSNNKPDFQMNSVYKAHLLEICVKYLTQNGDDRR